MTPLQLPTPPPPGNFPAEGGSVEGPGARPRTQAGSPQPHQLRAASTRTPAASLAISYPGDPDPEHGRGGGWGRQFSESKAGVSMG